MVLDENRAPGGSQGGGDGAVLPRPSRTALGAMELLHCTDGSFRLDGGAMFGVVPKPMWERKLPADEQNRVLLGTNCLLVRTGRETVLIETGVGGRASPKMRETLANQELLPASLRAAGVRPEEVDVVINTHLHFDHCGWNTMAERDGRARPTFPRARYVVAAGELAHARRQTERDRVSYLAENYEPMVETGQMEAWTDERIRSGEEVCPGVRLELYPGHTAHMVGVHLESRIAGGRMERGCFIGDLIPTSAHLQPTWCMGFDLDPLRVIEERHRFLRWALAEDALVLFPHDHAISGGRLRLDAKGRPEVREER